ncbi:unnamed protein product [Paramecium octaurelia]|uniref:Uncharacterized protein n=1 Tax=Paramecium octaurelia TaxID=43137 RepID=A0A8S1V884_PAROT|nr:unnamed protein product [Paramecium octaurelia]
MRQDIRLKTSKTSLPRRKDKTIFRFPKILFQEIRFPVQNDSFTSDLTRYPRSTISDSDKSFQEPFSFQFADLSRRLTIVDQSQMPTLLYYLIKSTLFSPQISLLLQLKRQFPYILRANSMRIFLLSTSFWSLTYRTNRIHFKELEDRQRQTELRQTLYQQCRCFLLFKCLC